MSKVLAEKPARHCSWQLIGWQMLPWKMAAVNQWPLYPLAIGLSLLRACGL